MRVAGDVLEIALLDHPIVGEESRYFSFREAGLLGTRQIPLSETALELIADWKARTKNKEPEALVFSTRGGKPISPNNVLRRSVFPACEHLGLPHATWLTFRRTYS